MTARWSQRRIADATGLGLDLYELDSGNPGPVVAVLGGVHGNEVGGILAAGKLTREALPLRFGRLYVVPVTHEAAFEADSRVGPEDGLNLARVFPGNQAGTGTERLAHLVTSEVLAKADALIDLHTSSPDSDMPLFVGCLDDGSETSVQAVRLARAFGLDVLWTHGELGPGRTLTAAHGIGIPAIYVESPTGGVLDAAYVASYVTGVQRVLADLQMVDDSPQLGECSGAEAPRLWLHGAGDIDAFSHVSVEGLFLAQVGLLDLVDTGDVVGTVVDTRARLLESIYAPEPGYVVTIRRSARVRPGTPVTGIVPSRPVGPEPLAVADAQELPSDAAGGRLAR